MKKAIHLGLVGVVALWAMPVRAILPQDAQYREREIIQQRVRARAEYEQQQQDYEKALIASRIKIEASMKKAPWMRAGSNGVQGAVDELPVLAMDSSPQINHRFLVSVVLLILTGLIAGWVRHATRKVDE
jgi:hypothetical protein